MIKIEAATGEELVHCAKYAGLDDRFDIWSAPREKILKVLRGMGYCFIDNRDKNWIVPRRG